MANAPHPTYGFLQRQLDQVGERDPLDVLAETADRLDTIVSAHPAERLMRRPAAGGWSANEVLAHLADMEWVFGFRARTILCDDSPTLAPIDQDAWLGRQHLNDVLPEVHAAVFRGLRSVNLLLWHRLPASELDRSAPHTAAGVEYSLGFMRTIHAGHDLVHLQQIERVLSSA